MTDSVDNVADDMSDAPVAPDVSAYEAKIAELTLSNAEKDAAYTLLNASLTASKAANYDLLMSVPKGTDDQESDSDSDSDESDDDIFEK